MAGLWPSLLSGCEMVEVGGRCGWCMGLGEAWGGRHLCFLWAMCSAHVGPDAGNTQDFSKQVPGLSGGPDPPTSYITKHPAVPASLPPTPHSTNASLLLSSVCLCPHFSLSLALSFHYLFYSLLLLAWWQLLVIFHGYWTLSGLQRSNTYYQCHWTNKLQCEHAPGCNRCLASNQMKVGSRGLLHTARRDNRLMYMNTWWTCAPDLFLSGSYYIILNLGLSFSLKTTDHWSNKLIALQCDGAHYTPPLWYPFILELILCRIFFSWIGSHSLINHFLW